MIILFSYFLNKNIHVKLKLTLVELRDDPELLRAINYRQMNGLNWFRSFFNNLHVGPEAVECCGSSLIQAPQFVRKAVYFSSEGFLRDISMYRKVCGACRKVHVLDGRAFGILNYGNAFLVTVEMFRELLELKTNSGIAVYAWWKMKVSAC
jgi:hypothetical protein